MHSAAASRRVGASLAQLLSTPSCRQTEQRLCHRATFFQQQQQQTVRAASTSTPRWQQQQQQNNTAAPKPQGTGATTPATPRTPVPQTAASSNQPLRSLTDGLLDPPPTLSPDEKQVDWTRSYHGLSASPFTTEQAAILQAELDPEDVEIKPDGIVYLPEIKYRRILNKTFGPGGWGLAPRGETIVTGKIVTREYGLVCGGRLISIARGEQQYFDPDGIPTATEGCKSNALMRCCKDLGIASELWDPRFIRKFLREWGKETVVEHQVTKKRRKHWMRKDDAVRYPFKEVEQQREQQTAPSRTGGGGQARR